MMLLVVLALMMLLVVLALVMLLVMLCKWVSEWIISLT